MFWSGYLRVLSPDFYSSSCGKRGHRKILQENLRQKPPNLYYKNPPTDFCRGARLSVTKRGLCSASASADFPPAIVKRSCGCRLLLLLCCAPFVMDLLMGLFRGAFFDHSGVPENCPLALMGRFPSLMGRFPTLMGRFPECLNGPFSLLKIPGKQPIKKRGISRILSLFVAWQKKVRPSKRLEFDILLCIAIL